MRKGETKDMMPKYDNFGMKRNSSELPSKRCIQCGAQYNTFLAPIS